MAAVQSVGRRSRRLLTAVHSSAHTLSAFERLPVLHNILAHVVDAGAEAFEDRLHAPERAAALTLISRSVHGVARDAIFERLTLRLDEALVALAGQLEDGEGARPFVRDLEIKCTFGRQQNPERDTPTMGYVMALVNVVDALAPTLRRLHITLDSDRITGLVIADYAFRSIGILPALRVGSFGCLSSGYGLETLDEAISSTMRNVVRVFGPALTSLAIQFDGIVARLALDVPMLPRGLHTLRSFKLPEHLVMQIVLANASTLRHLDWRSSTRPPITATPLTALTSLALDGLAGDDVTWASVPALRALEVVAMPMFNGLRDKIPPGLHKLHLHLDGDLSSLLDISNWLQQRTSTLELRQLRITTHAAFAPRYASPAALALLADACRAESVRVEVEDVLGRWALSA